MEKTNPQPWRITRAPGDITVAAMLAVGAVFERRGRLRTHRAWLAAIPIVLVNYVAFRAQLRYWQSNLDRGDALLVSVALESIAIYLAWQAHVAQLADDSALRLRLAAYSMALGIGVLNYSHYMHPGWRPTPAAVVFGGMSAISPWLWSIHSRRESRDALKAQNKIEDHAVRLGATRWFFHAYRCVQVMWAATWTGVTSPARAIALYEERKAAAAAREPEGDPERDPEREPGKPAPARQRPRPRPVVHAPRISGMTIARAELEHDLVQYLLGHAAPWPGRNALAEDSRLASLGSQSTRRRFANQVLVAARTAGNGSGESSDGEHGA